MKICVSIICFCLLCICHFPVNSQDTPNFTRFYHPNGQVSSEGMMIDGKPDGYWKTYNVSGIMISEGLRTNFELDSTWNFYNHKGELENVINYKYGKKNGYSFTYSFEKSALGTLIAKELYLNDQKQGRAYYYYPSGKLKEEVNFVDGKKEGDAKEYDEAGNLITLLEYYNNFLINRERINRTDAKGSKQGVWKEFYGNGNIHKEMFYVDDQLDGIFREFSESGALLSSVRYEKGEIRIDDEAKSLEENIEIDFRQEYYDNGKLKYSGSFKNKIPVGIHRYYNEEGNILSSEVLDESGIVISQGLIDETGNINGPWKDLYPDGKIKAEGAYVNNLRSGKWIFYYYNGQKEQEGNYLRGNYEGTWRWYHSNGELWREEMYFNGREDGEFAEYDSLGNIVAQGNYINGEKEGFWRLVVGDHIEEGNYQSGIESGIWKHFYIDGTLQFIGEFVQGMPEGKHKFYYPDGSLMEERYYKRGLKEKSHRKFDEDGRLLITIIYKRDQEVRINGEKISLPRGSVTTIR
jgi:uncharacterized protein